MTGPAGRTTRRLLVALSIAIVAAVLVWVTAEVTRTATRAEACTASGMVEIALPGDRIAPADLEWAAQQVLGADLTMSVSELGENRAVRVLPATTVRYRTGTVVLTTMLEPTADCPPGADPAPWAPTAFGTLTTVVVRLAVTAGLRDVSTRVARSAGEMVGGVYGAHVEAGLQADEWPYGRDGATVFAGLRSMVGPAAAAGVYREIDDALHDAVAGLNAATGSGWYSAVDEAFQRAVARLRLLGDAVFDSCRVFGDDCDAGPASYESDRSSGVILDRDSVPGG